MAGRDSVFAGADINAQIGRDWMLGAYYKIDFASSTALDHIVSAGKRFTLVHQQSCNWPDRTEMYQAVWQKFEGQEK